MVDPGSADPSHWASVSLRCGTLAPSRKSQDLPSFTAACVAPGWPRRARRGSRSFAESIGRSHIGLLDGPLANAVLRESEMANESAGASASKLAVSTTRRLYMRPTRRTSHCVGYAMLELPATGNFVQREYHISVSMFPH